MYRFDTLLYIFVVAGLSPLNTTNNPCTYRSIIHSEHGSNSKPLKANDEKKKKKIIASKKRIVYFFFLKKKEVYLFLKSKMV